VVLRHRRSHDQDCVRIAEVLLCSSRAAAPERDAQTGHRRTMSNSSLVTDANHSQTDGEELAN
jgi:hypothetical protein